MTNDQISRLKTICKDENSFNDAIKIIKEICNTSSNGTPEVTLPKSVMSSTFKLDDSDSICFSETVKDITGYTGKEIKHLPDKLRSIIHEDDIQLIRRKHSLIVNDSSQNHISVSYRIRTKENNIVWLNEETKVIRNKELVIERLESFYFVITNQKNEEDKLLKSREQYKDLNSSKDKFISIVSHDLRSPFTSLLGFSEILINEPELSDAEKKEYLEYIYDASKTQLQMINYLLDWSRLQTGRLQIEPKRIPVKSLISNCVSTLTGAALRKNQHIYPEVSDELYFNVDERLINQSVSNLISNAIKFTPVDKNIFVTANKFKEGMIEIVVRDEGVGISEENQGKLFMIDQKVSLVGTEGEKGSGLGLTLVKEIIEKHGGDIWFYSQVNKGSEFHITLPEAKTTVLIVEDDPTISSFYNEVLKKTISNYDAVRVDNGYEAMSYILNKTPSLVITDHEMPLMNGVQLVEAIRKKDANRNVPIVVISAKLDTDVEERYTKLGVNSLVKKPILGDDLKELIRSVMF